MPHLYFSLAWNFLHTWNVIYTLLNKMQTCPHINIYSILPENVRLLRKKRLIESRRAKRLKTFRCLTWKAILFSKSEAERKRRNISLRSIWLLSECCLSPAYPREAIFPAGYGSINYLSTALLCLFDLLWSRRLLRCQAWVPGLIEAVWMPDGALESFEAQAVSRCVWRSDVIEAVDRTNGRPCPMPSWHSNIGDFSETPESRHDLFV